MAEWLISFLLPFGTYSPNLRQSLLVRLAPTKLVDGGEEIVDEEEEEDVWVVREEMGRIPWRE